MADALKARAKYRPVRTAASTRRRSQLRGALGLSPSNFSGKRRQSIAKLVASNYSEIGFLAIGRIPQGVVAQSLYYSTGQFALGRTPEGVLLGLILVSTWGRH